MSWKIGHETTYREQGYDYLMAIGSVHRQKFLLKSKEKIVTVSPSPWFAVFNTEG